MAKKVDPAKAKAKKQKIIAVVGAVVLVGLLAFEIPNVMKQLNKKPPVSSLTSTSPTSATPPATAGTPSLAAPTLSGNEQSAPATTTTSGSLASGEVAPPVQEGQLASFSRFASKDPFAQQLSDSTAGSSPPAPSSSPSSTPSSGGASTGSSTSSGSVPTSSGSATPAPGSAIISVNGVLTSVTTGTDFPQPTADDPGSVPLFHLISLTAHTARISIAGGSYSSGAASIILREDKPVTLMNTADGTRYKLILKPQGTAVPSGAAPTSSGSTAGATTPAVTLPAATP